MSWHVDFTTEFAPNHRHYSWLLLKTLYANIGYVFHQSFPKSDSKIVPLGAATMRIKPLKGDQWLFCYVVPFAILHETLHFLIGLVTKRDVFIRLIPPTLDLFYFPLGFWLILHNQVWGVIFLFIGYSLGYGNLTGDFGIVKHGKKPESGQPEIDKPVN